MRYFVSLFLLLSILSCNSAGNENSTTSMTADSSQVTSLQGTTTTATGHSPESAALADSSANLMETFNIEIFRQQTSGNLVTGTIGVNGQSIGPTYENNNLKINSGTYPGYLRYISQKGHVQSPDGYMGDSGDFLLEIGNVTWSNGTKRTSLLFHGGNQADQSQGCIMLGPVSRDANGNRVLPPDHALRRLRTLFYGTNDPVSSPNKQISITIH